MVLYYLSYQICQLAEMYVSICVSCCWLSSILINESPANELRLLVLKAGELTGDVWVSTILRRLGGTLTWGSSSISQTPEIVRFSNILECTNNRESFPITLNMELSDSVVPLQEVSLALSDNGEDGEDSLVATGGRL
ncbi:hypothetical protein DPMN_042576 [Dreissena polymorpha]|uniref:Uncharacterized protein n=1 Tax=Dreissena polymorpha TaxID=45954 RepID=A0A9D4HYW8_DREPO|nr:hypothetical protein DPMN_042576 [Dreissena polymorpha]